MQELPYGGWVAPNIYYLGYAGVVNFNGVRIGGLSGIYKGFDFYKGHFEYPPYDDSTKRSVYHYRQQEIFRLKQLSDPIDIMMSHDWPREVYNYGNATQLCKFKPHFRAEIEENRLGSPPCFELLKHLKPTYWFSGHLHCKFAAVIPHDDEKETKFLALDKCLPNRRFLQIIDMEASSDSTNELQYDLEWLTILHLTKHLTSVKPLSNYMPGPGNTTVRWNFIPTSDERDFVLKRFDNSMIIPKNFEATAEAYDPNQQQNRKAYQPKPTLNPQTSLFCDLLDIDDPLNMVLTMSGEELTRTSFIEELNATGNADLRTPEGSDTEDLDTSYSSTAATANGMTPLKKRLSLFATLPPPKNQTNPTDPDEVPLDAIDLKDARDDSMVEDESDINHSNESNVNDTFSSVNTSMDDTELKNSLGSPEKRESNDVGTAADNLSAVKKFKRRNASIYNADADD